MNKFVQALSILIAINISSSFASAEGFDFGDNSIDFGLLPPAKAPSGHNLPTCEEVAHLESVPGVLAHGGHCLGLVTGSKKVEHEKYAVTLLEEYVDRDHLVRIVKRNPLLMSLAGFLKFCEPKGGILSFDELHCEYTIDLP